MAKEFMQKFATLLTGAFSFLAALAWNDTVKMFIQKYISPGNDLDSMFIYALFVTIIAVFVSYYINKAVEQMVKKEQQMEKKIINLEEKIIKHQMKDIKKEDKEKK